MKVLHVTSYYPPDRLGGVGEVVANIHHELLARGHQSTVLSSGSPCGEPDVRRVAGSPASFAVVVAGQVQLTRNVDLVHMHHGEGLPLLMLMRLLRIDTPVLLTMHVSIAGLRRSLAPYCLDGLRMGRHGLAAALYRNVVMRAREWMDIIALRMSNRQSFISISSACDSLPAPAVSSARVIYNGLPPPSEPTSAASPVELLYVGANSVRKRVEQLPFILAEVRARHPGTRLRIIGFLAADNPELCAHARNLGVWDAIVFEGRMRSDELSKYYRGSRVLLVPSAYEGLPMVILEAFQHGLPCVATRVSGHPEAVEDGRNGFLVTADTPSLMAAAAVRILDDPDLAQAMGRHARETVESRFGLEHQVDEYEALYREMT